MANYTNTLTDNQKIWIEQNIYDDQYLITYTAPIISGHAIAIAYFENEDGRFYSLQPIEKFEERDLERWTILEYDLECLNLKTVNEKRRAILKIIEENYQGENIMNTVEIHNKQFTTAKDALAASIKDLMQFNQDVIDELDESDLPGLAYGFKIYALRGLTDEVIEYFAGVVLGKETVTNEIIEQIAWELADYSSTFETI